MTELKISDVFAESANRLPKDAKAKLFKVFMLLTNNPRHPSLQLKKIQGSFRSDIYECRVDRFWRLVVQDLGGKIFQLVYVGAHDEAIEYGAMVREPLSPFAYRLPALGRVESYLSGDDEVLDFAQIALSELGALLENAKEGGG